jgi:formylglycine-generating enzyme
MVTDAGTAAERLPAGYEYRLPTEAQWEYACRAGTTTRFSYGDDPNYSQLGEYAWCSNNNSATHAVGEKKPNPWGLYDMHGNVSEWCWDYYGAYPGGSAIDPKGPSSGFYRVLRGGGCDSPAHHCRSAQRFSFDPSTCYYRLGFCAALVAVP